MTPDVNVLVAASRSDHPHHKVARAWLNRALAACAQGATLKLMPMVIASFLRLVTSPRVFTAPSPIDEAIGFLDSLRAVAGVELPALGGEWPILRQLCLDKQLHGNDLPDAWLAASVIHSGEHLATFDIDFRKLLRPAELTVLAVA
jgi:toxin-antitoxin system PIN domain toxin